MLCSHKHLLPLYGFCFDLQSPSLVYPLKRGASLACRLRPTAKDREYLSRLGWSSAPPSLTWRQRVVVLRQSIDALIYLHTPTESKDKVRPLPDPRSLLTLN